MNPPSQTPKLPIWIFFLTDAFLVVTAWFVAMQSARPLSTTATFTIFACIFGGALIAVVPLVARFERQKNEALDERQRELEALAHIVSSSAEQIGIVAGGLHEITELTQKNLRHADHLPLKLQEKIAEFKLQLDTATDAEKEELEKELESLRSSESERLESLATKIAKTTAEWARLEAATHQHLSAVSAAIEKLSSSSISAISRAQAAAEQALHQARTEAIRALNEEGNRATKYPEAAHRADSAEPESPPVLAESIPEITPVAPDTADPFLPRTDDAAANPIPAPPSVAIEPLNGTPAASAPPKVPRKKTPKPPQSEAPEMDFEPAAATADSDSAEVLHPGAGERVMTSDGATRLVVTAYIGIGNRLFIRGEGPGLSWEKGVPLQFVSIGKWRWETNDAAEPVKFRIYKNDDLECSALGTQSLDPGHQQEVNAVFQ